MQAAKIVSPHAASWREFWGRFPALLNDGLERLTERLGAEGISCPRFSCGMPTEWVEMLTLNPSAERENEARFVGGSLTIPVKVNLQCDGVIPWTLGDIPWLTERGSFIHGGAEYVVTGQLAHSPGVFVSRVKLADSEYVRVDVRSPEGRSIRVIARGESVQVEMSRNRRIDLNEAIAVLEGTAKSKDRDRYALAVLCSDPGELGCTQFERRRILAGLDPIRGDITPGERLKAIGSLAVAYLQDKQLPEDDPWDLGNLRVRLIGDFLEEALNDWFGDLYFRLRRKAVGDGQAESLTRESLIAANGKDSSSRFSVRIRQRSVLQSTCIRVEPDSGNFVEAAAYVRRVTFNGPGGIAIGHERDPRSVNWSHTGRLCPFDTPQSNDVGITLSLAGAARVDSLGQIASRCLRIDGSGTKPRVTDDEVWVTPWKEVDGAVGWIAFPDEREALEEGREVWAHCGRARVQHVAAASVTHIHTSEEDMISVAASLVPYRAHNDALRVVMACNFLRQALPLRDAMLPAVATGVERELPKQLPFAYGSRRDETLVFGTDLLVGYLPWKGWNFEDAIVVSTSAAEKLTSLHYRTLGPYPLERSLDGQMIAIAALGATAFDRTRLDDYGVVRVGLTVEPGDVLIVEPFFEWGKKDSEGVEPRPAPEGCHGVIQDVILADSPDGRAWVRIVVAEARRAEPGDKLGNRHGHKGVISRVQLDHEMPYVLSGKESSTCSCGETRGHRHLEILINPLSVISRMNLGQLIETIAARGGSFLEGGPERIPCFDPAAPRPERQLGGDVLVGFQYVMKLDHNAADKLHARSIDPNGYTAFAQQPLGGRRLNGGQRMGEMEVWALAAHGVPGLLAEMLTLKSDNPWARRQMAEDMVNDSNLAAPELPSALRTWAALCKGLGLELSLQDKHGKIIDLLRVNRPHSVDSLNLSFLDTDSFKSASFGQVDQSSSTGKGLQPKMRYHPDGLESEQIFGPTKDHSCACGRFRRGRERGQAVDYRAKPQFPKECPDCLTPLIAADERRYRMGYIALARPVPNPYVLFATPVVIGGMSLGFATGVGSVSVTFSGILDGTLSARVHGSDPVAVAGNLIVALMTALPEFETAAQALLGDGALATDGTRIGPREVFAKLCLAYELNPQQKGSDSSERLLNDLLGKIKLHPVDFAQKLLDTAVAHTNLHVLPVIPPSLRPPMFRENDITFLYQRVIEADENLRASTEASQEDADYAIARTAHFRAIARLMCNHLLPLSHRSSDWSGAQPQLRRSISSMLSGKTGLLLGNLLGKRVDFSARAVIVPAPDLPIDACRLPFDLAVELYRPLLASALRRSGERDPDELIARACGGVVVARDRIATALEPLFKKFPVVLNRQPTLHRLGMMAFQPRLGEGAVIGLPALVTAGFNADFDGDQMAVYLPTSLNGRRETEHLLPSRHLWHPADGRYALNLSQDLVLGGFLLGEGDHDALESKIEDSAADPGLADRIHIQSERAFAEVSRHGISFAGDDLRAIATRTTIGDADDCKAAIHALPSDSPIRQIVLSGARGKWAQLPYLAGTVFSERPGSNLVNGLTLGERFKLAGDSRDNLVDTKLGTAEGGMLTKFFVAFAEHLYIDADDCGTTDGLIVTAERGSDGEISAGEASRLRRRLFGRVLATDCTDLGMSTGHILGRDDTEGLMQWLLQAPGSNALRIRSPLTCQSKPPACVCRRCYGVPPWVGRRRNSLDASFLVAAGTLVGIIAAQSAGEPSTQMALRSKHLAAGQERGGAAVEKIRKLLAKPLEGQSGSAAQRVDTTQRISDIDRFFTAEDVSVAGVHIEVLVRGRMTMAAAQGWVAQLVGPGANFDQRFARFALNGARDPLADLKARTVIGARVGA